MIHFLALVIAILKLPESPRWLALSGYYDAALSVLFSLRNDMGIAARELAGVNECCRGEEKGAELFLQNTNFRKIVWLLLSLGFIYSVKRYRDPAVHFFRLNDKDQLQ